MEKVKVSKETIIRTICLALALANMLLKASGRDVLPIDDAQVNTVVSDLWLFGASLWAWWKNNSFSKAAIIQDAQLKHMKQNGR